MIKGKFRNTNPDPSQDRIQPNEKLRKKGRLLRVFRLPLTYLANSLFFWLVTKGTLADNLWP